ncbi:MAG: ester cyclase [Actinomycetota bacterium]
MTTDHAALRDLVAPMRAAMYDWTPEGVRDAVLAASAPDAIFQLAHPFNTLGGPEDFVGGALDVLHQAWPDLERRDYIVTAGDDSYGGQWVGCAGDYTGTFARPFLDIPPTGHQVSMRFHEFFRIEDGRITEMQALWDIPEVMIQAGAWPMGPSLGRDWRAPGPALSDGLRTGPRDTELSERNKQHVIDMLGDMVKHPGEPVEAMRLEHWWHEKFSWYGPAGIGTGRGVSGFRNWHQIPFLKAMPDRAGGYMGETYFFGDGPFVGETAWPGMTMHLSGDGFLGIVATGTHINGRSLDFWRVEDTPDGPKIRENWVLFDILYVWDQLGVDVMSRMRELTSAPRIAAEGF